MSWRSLFESAFLGRTIAAGGVGRLCAIPFAPPDDVPRRCRRQPIGDKPFPPTLVSNLHYLKEIFHNFVYLCSTRHHVTSLEASSPSSLSPSAKREYDFVILGNGSAGRAAVETLQDQCPGASIALVDPLRPPSKRHNRNFLRGIDYLPNTAVSLDPLQRKVGLLQSSSSSSSTQAIPLRYKYGLLIATGAHAAPPPPYLLDELAQAKVWELRPTTLLHPESRSSNNKKNSTTRPFLPPSQVRAHLVKSAQKGQSVGILGSSWDALDMAVATAAVSRRTNRPLLLFGASGPLSHCLPMYLSTAVSKRLKQRRIRVQDRSLVRYINHDDSTDGLQIYAARSFDFLESSRSQVDQVVIAPDTLGPRGNAVRPTLDVPDHLQESREGRFWNVSWSQLSMTGGPHEPSLIVCYKDDGRIAVNSELCAATGVYAAGSVAKCGNALTGHADVTGEGVHDGTRAGQVAALNMARHYQQGSLLALTDGPLPAVVRDSLPVWRSDVLSYDNQPSALASMGIHCLCVGTCDSERYATHGVWWTNQAAQQRILRLLEQDEATYGDANDITPEQSKRRRQRMKESNKAVYGLGIVYYLDRTGRIQGIMTWGLPFTHRRGRRQRRRKDGDSEEEINPALLEHMQQVIFHNGGMNSLESEFDQMRMSKYLAEESRVLVGLALAAASPQPPSRRGGRATAAAVHESHQLHGGDSADFPRPLHRYTDPKPVGVRSHGVLKRRDGQGQGLLGEDLFSRYQRIVADPSPPQPVTDGGVGFAAHDGAAAISARNWYEFQVYEQREQRWTENESLARPPKEDRIWIRKGDETRHVSAADTRAAVMDAVVGVHRAR